MSDVEVPLLKDSKKIEKVKKTFAFEVLRNEYTTRAMKNPKYSLRSFAQFLGVSHSLLSLVLNELRTPSHSIIEKLCDRCHFSQSKRDLLFASLPEKKSKPHATPLSIHKNPNYHKMSLDEYSLISEWQHFAILSLLEISDTKSTPEFISERLGINLNLAKISFQRLIDLKIIEQTSNGKWKQRVGPIVVENTDSTLATKKFHKQLIGKAIESIYCDPMSVRDMSSTTFPMNPKNIPYALERIRQFRRQLSRELTEMGSTEEVYNLSVQIFPTSRRRKK